MTAAISLRDFAAAEQAAREALNAVDKTAHPRNYALYQAYFAGVLVALGKRDEALSVAAEAVARVPEFGPGRVTSQVDAVLRQLATNRDDPHVGDFLNWSASILGQHWTHR